MTTPDLRVLALAAAGLALVACSSTASSEPSQPGSAAASTQTSVAAPSMSTDPGQASSTPQVSADGSASPTPEASSSSSPSAPGHVTYPARLSCTRPSEALLERAGVTIASHPGTWQGGALVEAATTNTGTWYVLAVDRGHQLDNGTATEGGSRSLALTNGPTGGGRLIPLAGWSRASR
ncbi:hypothetical protein [Luteococcus peritonei]|uniref:Uncharacterized protein n=1 Tax=Luteococcus peritonei TaxID=88874 RepID=A0ABW4RV12_9ACTN